MDSTKQSILAPLFPLRGVFLFPGQLLPLHVFEPRYCQMIEDLLDGPGRIVMGTVLENQDRGGERDPAVLPVAGLGEIARHKRLPDGHFSILLFGLARVQIAEVPCDRMYRRVECTLVEEDPVPTENEDELHERLLAAIQSRTGVSIDEPDQVSSGQLTDILAQTLTVPQRMMEEIFAESQVGVRAAKVLAAHQQFPAEDDDASG